MKDHSVVSKIRDDGDKIVEDVTTLADDSATGISKLGDNLSKTSVKAMEDITKWVEGGAAQLSEGIEKLSDDAKDTLVGAATKVKKEVAHELSQYNSKAQEIADKVPGGFSKKAASYPWVAMSIALAIGVLVGSLLIRPAHRQPVG